MAEQALFSSQTFGGYKKEEVMAYIDRLCAEHSMELQQHVNESEELKNEINEKNNALTEKESSFNELLNAYEELRQHYMLLKEKSDGLEFENEKLKELNAETEKKLSECREHSREIEEKNQKITGTSVSFDQIESNAKSILLSAREGAQGIMSDAQKAVGNVNCSLAGLKEEAEKVKMEIENSFSEILGKIDSLSGDMECISDEKNTDKLAESLIHDKYVSASENISKIVKSIKENIFD